MKILLIFDDGFPVDKEKLINLLQRKSKFLKFDLAETKFSLPKGLLSAPRTFDEAEPRIKRLRKNYACILCFTEKQYNDNYFFHGRNGVTIFSFMLGTI